jgi:hypothetical protein
MRRGFIAAKKAYAEADKIVVVPKRERELIMRLVNWFFQLTNS